MSMSPLLRAPRAVVLGLLFVFALESSNSLAQLDMKTGLEGQIRVGSTHGGPIHQGVDDSQPLANAAFVVKQRERVVASFETDGQGRFHLALPAGKYFVSKKDWRGIGGNYGPFEVDIVAGQVKKVEWKCDTGMD
jgi:hypothetical protein